MKSTKSNVSRINKTQNDVDQISEIPDVKVNVSTSFSSDDEFQYPPIKKLSEKEWIVNPNSSFELTIENCNQNIAQEIRELMDDNEIYGYRKVDKLVGLFAKYNIRVKEVESYKAKYKPDYDSKIEELKANSEEWANAYEADRADILEEFREQALQTIYERPNIDLVTLFENEPKDITIDDELIKEYGFENLKTYLKYSDKPDKLRVFPKDHYSRPKFEELEKLGLAERGYKLPKDEILLTLTLKELNSIANHPEKDFKRKQQAVDYIMSKPNVDELIGKNISLREIFRLKPLPDKFSEINLTEISNAWNYTYVVVELFDSTFRNAFNFDLDEMRDSEYIKGYKINYHRDGSDCQCCKNHSEKTYSKNNVPRFPLHIGCNCYLEKIYDFD